MCCGRWGLALILVQFLLKSASEQSRVSRWLLDGRKLIAANGTDARTCNMYLCA